MKMLGHRFIAHPPNQHFTVRVVAHNHPVVSGIEDFETFDEPYYSEYEPGIHTLLEANYTTPATGYGIVDWDEDIARPQMYEHEYQDGRVLYLSLGHCRDKYDMQPMIEVVEPERCSWDLPVYYELLRRGIAWGLGQYED
jgi:hypothetical protein